VLVLERQLHGCDRPELKSRVPSSLRHDSLLLTAVSPEICAVISHSAALVPAANFPSSP
jgi:hypothetical protein